MILTKPDLEEAEKKIELIFHNRQDFDEFTLDLRVDRVFRRKPNISMNELLKMDHDTFMKEALKEVKFENNTMVISDSMLYFTPLESISSSGNHKISIYSKSTYARAGIRSWGVDEEIRNTQELNRFKPLINLKTVGTTVRINKHESIAHLCVDDFNFQPVYREEIAEMIDKGEFVIKQFGKALELKDVIFHPEIHGIVLYRDGEIQAYQGTVLTPKKIKDDDFEKTKIPCCGMDLASSQFYLSSSLEEVEIPNGFMGYVKENVYGKTILPYASHPNAPLIGPKSVFKGTITFENRHFDNTIIYPGQMQSVLELYRFKTPIEQGKKSKYYGQGKASTSR